MRYTPTSADTYLYRKLMHDSVFSYLSHDHNRLEALLNKATSDPDTIAAEPFENFRKGILRHIGIEERIIMPAIARYQNGKQAEVAARLRLDHGAIAALLVPPPSKAIIATIRHILEGHNELEEQPDGLYRLIDRLAGNEVSGLLERIISTPDPPLNPHNPAPNAMQAALRALERAGYTLIDSAGPS